MEMNLELMKDELGFESKKDDFFLAQLLSF